MTPLASLRQRLSSNVARPFLDAADDRFGSVLLKNPVSSQGRKTSRDMAQLDLEVPRAYLSTTFASPEFALIGCTEYCWQLTLSMTS